MAPLPAASAHFREPTLTPQTLDGWTTPQAAWSAFCTANPLLGLRATPWSWVHFQRVHGERMIEAGALVKLPNRRWIANAEKFPGAALSLILTGRLPAPAARARSRARRAA